ncbi:MAG: thioredoxin family protein [Saprospiraceae bacterium]
MTEHSFRLLLFKHDNCGICVALKPKVQELIGKEFPTIPLETIDLILEPEMRGRFLVFTAPTLLFMEGEKEWFRMSGTFSLSELKSNLRKFIPVTL